MKDSGQTHRLLKPAAIRGLEISMLNVSVRVLTHVNVVILVVRIPLPLLGNKWPEFSKIVASDLKMFLTILMSS